MTRYDTSIDPLYRVGTLAEACQAWGLDRKTVIWAYWRHEISMRKSMGTWIVDLTDMITRFGDPKYQIRDDT